MHQDYLMLIKHIILVCTYIFLRYTQFDLRVLKNTCLRAHIVHLHNRK